MTIEYEKAKIVFSELEKLDTEDCLNVMINMIGSFKRKRRADAEAVYKLQELINAAAKLKMNWSRRFV